MQDIVQPRPDQFRLRVAHKKVTTAALVQAGVNEAQLFGALVRLVKIDAPVVKDLARGKRLEIAVIRFFIAVAVRASDVYRCCSERVRYRL